ncbi:MAG: hypothetical protein M3Z33_10385 [Actinomycetota bacterium]|nr:hypothetical protein [Actinomycetota bacterium]
MIILILLALLAAPAAARDPGRWQPVGANSTPIRYFQGLTPDDQGNVYFSGVSEGVYRTAGAAETGGNYHIIPPVIRLREGYNHVGAITFSEGRVLLPLECYYPRRGGNTCKTASIGVADRNLRWIYYVKLDQQEIRKAMWAQASPDGQTLWTSSGPWLLGYRMADIAPANAAPGGAAIHPYRSLLSPMRPGGRSSGITGATFDGTRLLVAGRRGARQQVWSVDTLTGATRLEIERPARGESEGLAIYGGQLHWQVQPFGSAYFLRHPSHRHGLVLNFVERRSDASGPPATPTTPPPAATSPPPAASAPPPAAPPCGDPVAWLLGLCPS